MRIFAMAVLSAVTAAALSACGGGDDPAPANVAAANATVPASATVVGSVSGKSFAFGSGVPSFGTTATTTVTFGTGTSPAFTIASGTSTATGATTFGSCIFTVAQSGFATGPLAAGSVLTVNPCTFAFDTAGKVASGAPVTLNVNLQLGTTSSAPQQVQATISPSGALSVNGQQLGTVAVRPVTGGS
jgi:hypothetical protein